MLSQNIAHKSANSHYKQNAIIFNSSFPEVKQDMAYF